MYTAPSSQSPGVCHHQASRGRATQTNAVISGTRGRYDLCQAQSTLDGSLKPEECTPCRPISMPWLPAEAKLYKGLLWRRLQTAKCREPVGSWLGQKQCCPQEVPDKACERRDWQICPLSLFTPRPKFQQGEPAEPPSLARAMRVQKNEEKPPLPGCPFTKEWKMATCCVETTEFMQSQGRRNYGCERYNRWNWKLLY